MVIVGMMANLPRIKARRIIESGEYTNWGWKQCDTLRRIHFTAYGDAEATDKFVSEFVCQQVEAKYVQ